MASPDVLDFAKLLAPIPGENPAGRALREEISHDAPYYVLKDVRSTARAVERSMIFGGDETASDQRPDWRPILDKAPKVLAEQSKDLEVTGWLIEALVRQHGYAGLRDGLRLARELSENFWDHLYPLPDEEGVATRVSPLAALNGIDSDGVLIDPIQNMPITDASTGRTYGVSDYRQAGEVEQISDPEKRALRIAHGAASMEQVREAIRSTPRDFYKNLVEDVAACVEEWEKLGRALDEKCGKGPDGFPAAPPTSNVRNTLQACQDTIKQIARDVLGTDAPAEASAGGSAPAAGSGAGGAGPQAPGGPIRTREDAFRMLLDVAEFFKRTEPHSLVSYRLEETVRLGRMPLPELLNELIPQESALVEAMKLVGVRPKSESKQP
jgi:type VI secretion system protein ImpA